MLVKLEKEQTPVDLVETLVSQAKRASKTKKSAEDDDDFDELEESPKNKRSNRCFKSLLYEGRERSFSY
jgi:hypothetical protein